MPHRLIAFLTIAAFCLAGSAFAAAPLPMPNLQLGTGNGYVRTLVPLPDGGMLIGGSFESVNGLARRGIARLAADGSLNTAWNANLGSGYADVYAIFVSGSSVFVGGVFDQAGGQPRSNVASVSLADGSLVAAWNPSVNGQVHSLASDGIDLFVGGSFTQAGGLPRKSLARIVLSTGAVSAWTNDVNFLCCQGTVHALLIDGGNLYLGGLFDSVGGQPREGLARVSLSASNSADPAWIASADSNGVRALSMFGPWLYVGGGYQNLGGVARPGLGRVATASGAAVDTSWTPPGTARALFVDSSGVLAAGFFSVSGLPYRPGLAELDLATGAITSWDPTEGAFIVVQSLANANGYVYAGLSDASSWGRSSVVRMPRGGASDASYRVFVGDRSASIFAIAIAADGRAYVGGEIHGAEGLPISGLLRTKADGTLDPDWHPNPDFWVESIDLAGANLIAGGRFSRIGGLYRNRLAKISTGVTAVVDPAWNPNVSGANALVTHVAVSGSDVFVAGDFSSVSGVAHNQLAKIPLAGTGAPDPGWNALFGGSANVKALAVGGGGVFVGGSFLAAEAGQAFLVKLSPANGSRDTAWNPAPDSSVDDLVLVASQLFAAGRFRYLGDIAQPTLAKIDATTGAVEAAWMPQLGGPGFIANVGNLLYVDAALVNGRVINYGSAISVASGRPDFAWSADYIGNRYAIRGRNNEIWIGFIGHSALASRTGVAAFPEGVCATQPDSSPCNGGPGITGATCQASICTPALATTTTTLDSSTHTGAPGSPLTLTATVASTGAQATGQVFFYGKGGGQASATLANGVATANISYYEGFAEVTAIYQGSANHFPSRSAKLSIPRFSQRFDANGDGKSDLFWANSADGSMQGWLMNGLAAQQVAGLLPSGGYSVTHVADLDGDGKADLLIRHTDGTAIGWIMNGLAVASSTTFAGAGSGWSIVKTGDLNDDGKADLLWQHSDGSVQAWLMNGVNVTATATLAGAGSGWSISKVADLDGNGTADIIWQHSGGTVQAWLMDGLSATAIASFAGAGSGWSVALTGDLDGDGKADLVWQHSDGTTQAWLMNGLTASALASFTPAGAGWTPILAGDLNNDGKADFFWQHSSGASQTWIMNGLAVSSLASFVPAGSGWSATHLLDLNGDGRQDVLWKHTSGATQAWLMNGLTIIDLASLAGAGSYSVVPPAP